MKLPFRRKEAETKSDVMPEALWEQINAAQDRMGSIGLEQAVGLPAILAVIRLISHAAGLVPLNVLRGDETTLRARATETWQWRLLHRAPGPPPSTPFNFKADLAANFAGRGNAYVRKIKVANPSQRLTTGQTPRVAELMPLHAGKVKPRRENGAVVFDDSTGTKPITRGTDEIIQVRSFSTSDGLEGVSPIAATRMFVTAGLKRQQFEDRHLANGVFPSLALTYGPQVTEDQAKKWVDFIEMRHQGSGKAGKVIAVGGGAEITPLPISLQDAEFAQMTGLTLEQAAAMYQVPFVFLRPQRQPPNDDDWRQLISFAIAPVFTAIAEAFTSDRDLFDPNSSDEQDMAVVGDVDALMKLDPLKKAQVQREQAQTGTRLVDELRAQDGYEPLPPIPDDWQQHPGQIPQVTPVGGAPNPTVDTTKPAPADDPLGDNAEQDNA